MIRSAEITLAVVVADASRIDFLEHLCTFNDFGWNPQQEQISSPRNYTCLQEKEEEKMKRRFFVRINR